MNDICGIEFWNALSGRIPIDHDRSEGIALGYDGSGRWPGFGNFFGLF